MATKCIGRVGSSFGQVLVKLKLLAKFLSCPYPISLSLLSFADLSGHRENHVCLLGWDEDRAVRIGKSKVLPGYPEGAEGCRAKGFRVPRSEPLGPLPDANRS